MNATPRKQTSPKEASLKEGVAQMEPRAEPNGNSSQRKPLAIYALTRHGFAHAVELLRALPEAQLFLSERFREEAPADAQLLSLPLGGQLKAIFPAYACHVFVVSVGAVVRLIAPLLGDKKTDPAVVCVDDAARYSVCLLSGHLGGGNAWTRRVARVLGAQEVVTTASDALGTLSADLLGRELGWTLDDLTRNVTRACAAVVNGSPVLVVQESGEPDWWPAERPLPPGVHYTNSLEQVSPEAWEMLLIVSDRELQRRHPRCWERSVIYRPKSLWLGLGCDRDTPPALVQRGVRALLEQHELCLSSVRGIATIERKRDEAALLDLAQRYNWPLRIYSAAALDATEGIESPSETVRRFTGTRGVAEPAALRAAGTNTLALRKQIYTEPGAGRSMTLAVARIPFAARPLMGEATPQANPAAISQDRTSHGTSAAQETTAARGATAALGETPPTTVTNL